jgi:hypothetical protein
VKALHILQVGQERGWLHLPVRYHIYVYENLLEVRFLTSCYWERGGFKLVPHRNRNEDFQLNSFNLMTDLVQSE